MKPRCQSNSSRRDDRKICYSDQQRLLYTPMLASVLLLAFFLAACSTHHSAANKTTLMPPLQTSPELNGGSTIWLVHQPCQMLGLLWRSPSKAKRQATPPAIAFQAPLKSEMALSNSALSLPLAWLALMTRSAPKNQII
jgi:hypothetical protein